ncbi:MAG: hypothetical protein ACYTEX_20175 [Planctomycetota bacterium]|jgi:hypothetical protein
MGKQVAHPTGRSRPLAGDNFNRFLDRARNDNIGVQSTPYLMEDKSEILIPAFTGTSTEIRNKFKKTIVECFKQIVVGTAHPTAPFYWENDCP